MIRLLYDDTHMSIKSWEKKRSQAFIFFPASLLYFHTFTPELHRKQGGGAVVRCDIQQKMSDFTDCIQSGFELSLKEVSKKSGFWVYICEVNWSCKRKLKSELIMTQSIRDTGVWKHIITSS